MCENQIIFFTLFLGDERPCSGAGVPTAAHRAAQHHPADWGRLPGSHYRRPWRRLRGIQP
jgi:hypothetical protein